MDVKFTEVDKALRYLSNTKRLFLRDARYELDSIRKWQQVSVSEIHAIGKAACQVTDKVPHDLLVRECHERKVLYKDALRSKMKRRRFLRLVIDLNAWASQTRDSMSGYIGEVTSQGRRLTKAVAGASAEPSELDHAFFILSTPYKPCVRNIQFLGSNLRPWIVDAVESETGYEMFKAEWVTEYWHLNETGLWTK